MLVEVQFSPGGESMLFVAQYFFPDPAFLAALCRCWRNPNIPCSWARRRSRTAVLTPSVEVAVTDTSKGTSPDHVIGLGWAREGELIKEGTYA